MTVVVIEIQTIWKIYGLWPKNCKISGFSAISGLVPRGTNDFFVLKQSLFDKSTIKRVKKVCKSVQLGEIDEIRISPYTKCMVAIFDRKFLSA